MAILDFRVLVWSILGRQTKVLEEGSMQSGAGVTSTQILVSSLSALGWGHIPQKF